MGWIEDILKEVPLSSVLKERVSLAEQKYALAVEENALLKQRVRHLEEENSILKQQIPNTQNTALDGETARVLAYLFRAEGDFRDIGIMANSLQIETGLLKYHLDVLDEAGYATCTGGNYLSGHLYWALTPSGRRYAVEQKLINP
ncbi:MAG: hypothetical protein ACTHM2_18920 [Afipia sp.]